MTFKSRLAADLHAVFLNPSEFADLAEVAGHPAVPVVVENLELEMPQLSDDRPGMSYEGVTLHVAASDVPDDLRTAKTTTFRGERWYVLSCDCDAGLKTLRLYRERA